MIDINKFLEDNKLHINTNNIIVDKYNKPKMPNEIYESLLLKKQSGDKLTYFEDKIYGICIISLSEIILNNKKLKWQDESVKEDCRFEIYNDLLLMMPKYFDKSRGSKAYSLAFRIGYNSCIHVLKKLDTNRELLQTIHEILDDYLQSTGHKTPKTDSNLV